MRTLRRSARALCLAAIPGLAPLVTSGCGEPAPPPLTRENFDAGKKEAEIIIQKEYGQKAFDKAQAAEKARAK